MKPLPLLIAAGLMCWSLSTAAGASLLLADHGRSDYRIVIAKSASPSEKHAAAELQMFLEQICGARLPVVTDDEPLGEREIILGDNAHLRPAGVDVDLAQLGDEGFVIRTAPPHLIIAGGRQRGTMYGVYTLLEDHLGCRWFSSKVSRIPRLERVEITDLDERQTPLLEYREPFSSPDAQDGDWAARNRMNSANALLTAEHGGKIVYYTPWVHTFYHLIAPGRYFAQHPEWFSEIDGKRTHDHAQLCLTNEALIQEAIKNVKGWIKDHPEANIISVSQNDGYGWCTCKDCAALEQREGGAHSAPIVHFVNRIAEAIADEYPNVAIDTLAYSYSVKPPRTLKPRSNVIIRLCTGACCFSHPLASDDHPATVSLREDLQNWFKLTKRIYIWDYVCDYHHYIMPWPNLRVLGPNIKFFVDHGVRGIFEEGCYNTLGGDMAELKAYVMAKCLWNPRYDVEKAVREFIAGYYGPAARPVREYLDLLHDKVERDHIHMGIGVGPDAPYLTPEVIARADQLFDEAERLAASDAPCLERVKALRLSVQYVKLCRFRPAYVVDGEHYRPLNVPPWYDAAVRDFFAVAERRGITLIDEWRPLADYRKQVETGLRPYDAVVLENARLRVGIVPPLGGRIVSLRDKESNAEIMFQRGPAAPGYPPTAVGGYEEYASLDYGGPGADAEFSGQRCDQAEASGILLSAQVTDDLRLERRIELSATAPAVRITSVLTNTSDHPVEAVLRGHPEFAGGDLRDLVVRVPAAAGPGERIALIPPDDAGEWHRFLSGAEMARGSWELLDVKRGTGVRMGFDPAQISKALLNWSPDGPRVNLELYSTQKELAPGASLTLAQTIELMRRR
jgi:hypothetical protein